MNDDGRREATARALRRTYEWARARWAFVRGLFAGGVLGLASALAGHERGALMGAVAAALVTVGEWRGRGFADGVRRGLAAGALAWIVPAASYRSCCAVGSTWRAPCACGALALTLGLLASALVPRQGSATIGALGLALGVVLATAFRCTAFSAIELASLLGGLAAGVSLGVLVMRRVTPERDEP